MKKLFTITVLLSFVFIGCKKGDKGDPGINGNANVIAKSKVTIRPSDWRDYGFNSVYIALIAKEITQDIVDNGAVMTYYEAGTNAWVPLPAAYWDTASFNYGFYPGILQIFTENAVRIDSTLSFRAVIIPSNMRTSGVDFNDMHQVEAAGFKFIDLRVENR